MLESSWIQEGVINQVIMKTVTFMWTRYKACEHLYFQQLAQSMPIEGPQHYTYLMNT